MESKYRNVLEDKIYRSYGILSYARQVDSEEAMLHISRLRLGLFLNFKLPIRADFIDQLLFIIQPAHLQEFAGRDLTVAQRDEIRAELIRENLLTDKRLDE